MADGKKKSNEHAGVAKAVVAKQLRHYATTWKWSAAEAGRLDPHPDRRPAQRRRGANRPWRTSVVAVVGTVGAADRLTPSDASIYAARHMR